MKKVIVILAIVFGSLAAGVFLLAVGAMLVFLGFGGWFAQPRGDVLTYEVDPEFTSKGARVDMDAVRAVVARRLSSGILRARVEVIPKRRLRVTVFEPDPAARERVEHVMAMAGTLEFRILANNRDHRQLIRRADADPEATVIRDSTGERLGWWVPVTAATERADPAFLHYPEINTRTRTVGKRKVTEVLVANDDYNVTGDYLNSVSSDFGGEGGIVSFSLNGNGAALFSELTGHNLPEPDGRFTRKLGIILNGCVRSAPAIRSRISDRAQVTGFSGREAEDIAAVLNSGPLPVRLRIRTIEGGKQAGSHGLAKRAPVK